jgi:hypothetical protein
MLQEASMLSFNDIFYFLTVMIILLIPLILLMKRPAQPTPEPS